VVEYWSDGVLDFGVVVTKWKSLPSIQSSTTPAAPALHSSCDHDVTAASRPVKAFVPVRIRLVTPISMGRSLSIILYHKEGVPSVAKVLAVRVRFPAWSASVRSRHLPIITCRAAHLRRSRRRTASTRRLQWRFVDSPVV